MAKFCTVGYFRGNPVRHQRSGRMAFFCAGYGASDEWYENLEKICSLPKTVVGDFKYASPESRDKIFGDGYGDKGVAARFKSCDIGIVEWGCAEYIEGYEECFDEICKDAMAFEYIDPKLKTDKNFLAGILKVQPSVINFLPSELKEDKELVESCIEGSFFRAKHYLEHKIEGYDEQKYHEDMRFIERMVRDHCEKTSIFSGERKADKIMGKYTGQKTFFAEHSKKDRSK